jgi:hypothetical protein
VRDAAQNGAVVNTAETAAEDGGISETAETGTPPEAPAETKKKSKKTVIVEAEDNFEEFSPDEL